MAEPVEHAVLAPDVAARLTEFARTCKAAARAVSLYPAGHPAIVTTLRRVAEATAQLTARGPFAIQVQAQDLAVNGQHLARPDPAVAELAALLHRHLIGRLTLTGGAGAESWRTLLLLLARTPEEVRADGGIAQLWETAGGPSIEIGEIDYAEVLRERQGQATTIESIIAAAIAGRESDTDEASMDALMEIVGDPARLSDLFARLEAAAVNSAEGTDLHTAAFLSLLRHLVAYVSRTAPAELPSVFDRLAQAARHLSVESMISLLAERERPDAMAGSVDVVSGVVEKMSDSSVARFVADSVVAERGASERLAHAFQALAPQYDRQRQLLALAREEVAQSDLGKDDSAFTELWERVEGIMTSYSDAHYVSTDYARELSHARTQPMDVERTSDDPPDRIAAWLATVSDSALRDLDRDLLGDLLVIEADPLRWRDVAESVVGYADDLLRVGHVEQALLLVQKMIEEGAKQPQRRPHAAVSLERFGRGSLVKHLPPFLRGADPGVYEQLKSLCHAIGPSIIVPLAEGMASEQDARSRKRLRDILVGFGPRGAESVRPLMNAGNWEIRRTAAFLLREFGGPAGLKELVPLLSDSEPLVQREAAQALALNGSADASAILLQALLAGKGRTRDTLIKEVVGMREHAAPFFAHVLREQNPSGLPEVYEAALDVLGGVPTDEAAGALKVALHAGQWWTPFANRRRRAAAARSLRRLGTPAALGVLREAADRGSSGVRSAARAELDTRES